MTVSASCSVSLLLPNPSSTLPPATFTPAVSCAFVAEMHSVVLATPHCHSMPLLLAPSFILRVSHARHGFKTAAAAAATLVIVPSMSYKRGSWTYR